MERLVSSISLEYGDTKISFFGIKITDISMDSLTWHRHNYYELHYCVDKSREYKFQNKSISFKFGQTLIIPPGIDHNTVSGIDAFKKPPVALIFSLTKIKSDLKFYDKISTALKNNSLKPLYVPKITSEDIWAFQDIVLYDSFLGLCKLKSIASNLMFQVFNTILNDITFPAVTEENMMVLIDNLIYNPQYTLSQIAKVTNYSQRQLSRIIKQHYGVTFSELRRNIKKMNQ